MRLFLAKKIPRKFQKKRIFLPRKFQENSRKCKCAYVYDFHVIYASIAMYMMVIHWLEEAHVGDHCSSSLWGLPVSGVLLFMSGALLAVAHTYVHVHSNSHTYIHIYIYIHTYIYICSIYIYMSLIRYLVHLHYFG